MAEFLPGSGFYPPTVNSATFNSEDTTLFSQGGTTTVTLTITADERYALSSLNWGLIINSLNGAGTNSTLTAEVRAGDTLLWSYSSAPDPLSTGVFIDQQRSSLDYTLEKGSTLTFTITIGGPAGWQVNASTYIWANGRIIFY